ncbi:hypothetical protein Hamer_G005908 [Homarus americanus]|uniref:Uncharacterized protein n=1 Tax=Homarus americanus TaxID=6706 RepID=A0A8J5JK15_HOMAM|nr:hypothetical protein Hamer_G005908 [Homarus americanus]
MTFALDVRSLSRMIEEMGNLFKENTKDLLVLDSKDVADASVAETMRHIENLDGNNMKRMSTKD